MQQPQPDPGETYPARQHAAVRHRRSRGERRHRALRPAAAVQRARAGRRAHQRRVRAGLHHQLPGGEEARPEARGVPRRDGRLRARDAAGASRRSRASSPSTTDGSRGCRRRRSATACSSMRPRRTATSSTTRGDDYYKWINGPAAPTIFNRLEEAGLTWRVYYDESQLVSLTGHAARARAAEVLEVELPRDVAVPRRRPHGQPAGVRLHRAAHGLQPQRHAPAVGRAERGRPRSRRRDGHADRQQRATPTCARATRSCRRSTTRSGTSRVAARVERHEHRAGHHLRRARRHVRPRRAAERRASRQRADRARWASASTASACACPPSS